MGQKEGCILIGEEKYSQLRAAKVSERTLSLGAQCRAVGGFRSSGSWKSTHG